MSKDAYDTPYSADEIRRAAGLLAAVRDSPDMEALRARFGGEQSDDFYRGLLTGYANAAGMLADGLERFLPLVVAFIADQLEKKEIV